jgi:hypothetical protein
MGTVHSLQSSPRGRPVDGRAADIGPCEVIIFPGVRIERHDADFKPENGLTGALELDGLGGTRQPPEKS